jgi:16S rRNA (cytosine967-C5)-methyltransferase
LRGWRIEAKSHLLRSVTLDIIQQVEQGRPLDETIDWFFSRGTIPEALKPLLYEITAGVFRWKGYLDWVLSHYVRRPPKKDARYLLWVALYQSLFMKKGTHHVVNETVEYVKKEKGVAVANFVNAVLRKVLKEGRHLPLPELPDQRLSFCYSFPEWLVRRWLNRLGQQETEALLSVLNTTPEFSLRVDQNKIARDVAIEKIRGKGITAQKGKLLESAITVDKVGPLLSDELFKSLAIHVQDEASQLVGQAVAPEPGDVVLDACAGLGTKTEQMIELYPEARFVATDLRIGRISAHAERLSSVRGDLLRLPFKKNVFDVILLDAPCSSLGIVRKHPEIKWRRNEEEILRFGTYQRALLSAVWPSLKPGGRCVYSVCSFEPEETTDVIRAFAGEEQFVLENPLPFLFNKEYFLSLPHRTGVDGFFIAKLRKV